MDEYLSPKNGNSPNVNRYVCEECGNPFFTLEENIEHYKHLHPRSIGTAIT